MSESNQSQKIEGGLHPSAYEIGAGDRYQPYVFDERPIEFTLKSVLTGAILGILFGAANAYLGLMAGLTISTSIPVAVMTVVLFRAFGAVTNRQSGILEANMSQTIGSASSSVASGVLFTIPALFLWGLDPSLIKVTMLACGGGLIGILCMIPLRQYLIKREHGHLPYPEGLACAEVLVASDRGGKGAINVFYGLGVGAVFKLITTGLSLITTPFKAAMGKFVLAIKVSPALIGVGYILGPRIATVMVSGSALSAFIIIPAIAFIGQNWEAPLYPETEQLISEMAPSDIWDTYVRYIGAGAVAAAGILTLIRSFPMMLESFRLGIGNIRGKMAERRVERRDHDLPISVVVLAILAILAFFVIVPDLFDAPPAADATSTAGEAATSEVASGATDMADLFDNPLVKSIVAALIGIFAFFFVTVAARIVGLVGVTSNPTSGMTIATLLGTSVVFLLLNWTGMEGKATALMVGTAVCIAASIAGDTSQDLKTGFLLGATPYRQQLGELAGVLASAFFVCWTVFLLDETYTIGGQELPAPQATMMKVVIDGVIDQSLPWTLILLGIGIALVAAACRIPALPFAVGVYLPLSTMGAVFLGGLLRWWMTRKQPEQIVDQRRKAGVLFGSGLVGGEGLMGVLIALYVLIGQRGEIDWSLPIVNFGQQFIAAIAIGVIVVLIGLAALKRNQP